LLNYELVVLLNGAPAKLVTQCDGDQLSALVCDVLLDPTHVMRISKPFSRHSLGVINASL